MGINDVKHKKESLLRLFLRFLRFGFLAWGGPVAQIDMIRKELVEDEKWISKKHFNRILGTYQFLPGPEANELCVYFGMKVRRRLGGLLAGIGFMLPGFILMLLLSWFYVKYGIVSPIIIALFYGFQPAVIALIARAVHRIGQNVILNDWLFSIAIFSAILEFLGVHFIISLGIAGFLYFLVKRNYKRLAVFIGIFLMFVSLWFLISFNSKNLIFEESISMIKPSKFDILISGFRTGLLTFGGAYTAVPFMQHDAVEGGWLTNKQFLDGLALSGILPAPFIIFTAFIGFVSGGLIGALLITLGVFLPAFAFTLIGYEYVERISKNKRLQVFLDGLTAGVVGLIAATTLRLLPSSVTDLTRLGIFALALVVLYKWKSRMSVPVVVLGAGLLGLVFYL